VRLPGEQGHALMEQQNAEGITLHAGIMDALRPWADKLKVALPAPI
jgi:LDH2 family malate/lactate/ureidoglycolate dehydrogenase